MFVADKQTRNLRISWYNDELLIFCSFFFPVNVDNTVGAIGFVSRILPAVYPISIIKVDADGEPIRNAKGLCQVCEPSK